MKLEVLRSGQVIRTYTNKKDTKFKSWPGGPSKPETIPSKKGYNRFTWDFRRESLPAVEKVFAYGSYAGSRIVPGTYTLRLTLDETTSETDVTVLPNPNVAGSATDYSEQQKFLRQVEGAITDIHESVNKMRSAKTQLETYAELLKDNNEAKDLLAKGKTLIERITTWEENLIQPKQKTFQDVINYHNQLNAEFMELKDYADVVEPKLTNGAKDRLTDLLAQWKKFEIEHDAIVNTEMGEYNETYKELALPALILKK